MKTREKGLRGQKRLRGFLFFDVAFGYLLNWQGMLEAEVLS